MRKIYKILSIIFSIIFILYIGNIYIDNLKVMSKEKTLQVQNIYLGSKIQGEIYYRVVVGSFKIKSNAENMVNTMNSIGYDSFISTESINGEIFNRVIVGSFKNKENANKRVKELNKLGYEAFIDIYVQ